VEISNFLGPFFKILEYKIFEFRVKGALVIIIKQDLYIIIIQKVILIINNSLYIITSII
jgi:hypothetical protein